MSEIHKNYIGGEWVAGDAVTRDVNPSNTNDIVGEYAQANAAQTDRRRSRRRRPRSPPGRARRRRSGTTFCLRVSQEILARREELGRLLAREEGKTLPEAIGEVGRAAQIFDFFAGETLRIPGEKLPACGPGSTSR